MRVSDALPIRQGLPSAAQPSIITLNPPIDSRKIALLKSRFIVIIITETTGGFPMSFRVSHCATFTSRRSDILAIPLSVWSGTLQTQFIATTNLFVVNGDLTTYKATIKERNLWIDMLIRMANHAPVLLTAGNHGAELTGDL